MELNELAIYAGAILLALAISGGLALIVRRGRAWWVALAVKVSPDQFDAIARDVVAKAYDAVEQMATAYEAMTSKQKQDMAIQLIRESLQYLTGAKPPEALAKMLLEAFIKRFGADGVPLADRG